MAIRIIKQGLSEAEVQALIDDSLSGVPAGQPPEFAAEPTGFSDGQLYRNTTDGILYVRVNGSFEPVDTHDVVLTDLSGNTISLT